MSESVATKRYKAKQRRRASRDHLQRVIGWNAGLYGSSEAPQASAPDLSAHVIRGTRPEKPAEDPMNALRPKIRALYARAGKYAAMGSKGTAEQRRRWLRKSERAMEEAEALREKMAKKAPA